MGFSGGAPGDRCRLGQAGGVRARPVVLIVDDDSDILMLWRFCIERALDVDVVDACDGRQGVEVALRERPDAVVTGISMPRLGGLEMARELRACGFGATPMLACSARISHEHMPPREVFDAAISKLEGLEAIPDWLLSVFGSGVRRHPHE